MADVIELIKVQHRRIDELLGRAESADPKGVAALLQQAADLLVRHSQAEESFVYPAIRDHDRSEEQDVEEGLAEHDHIDELLQDLLRADPTKPGFDGRLAAMIGELRHHVQEEETILLPALAEQADTAEREQLGARFAEVTGDEAGGDEAGGDEAGGAAAGEPGGTSDGRTRDELYQLAKEQSIAGRSAMSKDELARALDEPD
jgi:iron-sulfur cluster repair protein YtfE (RIC family)